MRGLAKPCLLKGAGWEVDSREKYVEEAGQWCGWQLPEQRQQLSALCDPVPIRSLRPIVYFSFDSCLKMPAHIFCFLVIITVSPSCMPVLCAHFTCASSFYRFYSLSSSKGFGGAIIH